MMLTTRHVRLAAMLASLKLTGKRAPVFFSFYITSRCNLRCKYCFIHSPATAPEVLKAEFTPLEAYDLLDQAYTLGTRMVFLVGGEPLVYPHLGEVLAHIRKKGMVCHILTNGTLMKDRLEELRLSDGVCVSLDGLGQANDLFRGDGVCDRVLANLEWAVKAGIKCRLHSVLNRHNLNRFEEFLQKAAELGVPVTVSPPAYVEQEGKQELSINDREHRNFWRELLAMKEKGLPVGHTYATLRAMAGWPGDYRQPLKAHVPLPSGSPQIVRCVNAEYYCGVDATGRLHFCLHPGMANGLNAKTVGFAKAWNHLTGLRPDCHACASPNALEYSAATRLTLQGLMNALRFQIFRRY